MARIERVCARTKDKIARRILDLRIRQVFANDQWHVELGATLDTSLSYEAVRGATDTIVMVDKPANVLHRVWCVFEMRGTQLLGQSMRALLDFTR